MEIYALIKRTISIEDDGQRIPKEEILSYHYNLFSLMSELDNQEDKTNLYWENDNAFLSPYYIKTLSIKGIKTTDYELVKETLSQIDTLNQLDYISPNIKQWQNRLSLLKKYLPNFEKIRKEINEDFSYNDISDNNSTDIAI